MPMNRRDFLKTTGAGLGALALSAAPVKTVSAKENTDETGSMLYELDHLRRLPGLSGRLQTPRRVGARS